MPRTSHVVPNVVQQIPNYQIASPNNPVGFPQHYVAFPNNPVAFSNFSDRFPNNKQGIQNNHACYPSNVTQFPNNPQSFPNNQQGIPNNQMGYPNIVTRFPNNTQGFPNNHAFYPSNVTQFPNNPQSFPNNHAGYPDNVMRFPNNTQGFPNYPQTMPQIMMSHPNYVQGFPNYLQGLHNNPPITPNIPPGTDSATQPALVPKQRTITSQANLQTITQQVHSHGQSVNNPLLYSCHGNTMPETQHSNQGQLAGFTGSQVVTMGNTDVSHSHQGPVLSETIVTGHIADRNTFQGHGHSVEPQKGQGQTVSLKTLPPDQTQTTANLPKTSSQDVALNLALNHGQECQTKVAGQEKRNKVKKVCVL